jgi:hypothetical protein
MDIVKKFLKTSIELEAHYHEFWNKIFHNDAYVFIKNAILFYKIFKIIIFINFIVLL